jgi:hypothetical protein
MSTTAINLIRRACALAMSATICLGVCPPCVASLDSVYGHLWTDWSGSFGPHRSQPQLITFSGCTVTYENYYLVGIYLRPSGTEIEHAVCGSSS